MLLAVVWSLQSRWICWHFLVRKAVVLRNVYLQPFPYKHQHLIVSRRWELNNLNLFLADFEIVHAITHDHLQHASQSACMSISPQLARPLTRGGSTKSPRGKGRRMKVTYCGDCFAMIRDRWINSLTLQYGLRIYRMLDQDTKRWAWTKIVMSTSNLVNGPCFRTIY